MAADSSSSVKKSSSTSTEKSWVRKRAIPSWFPNGKPDTLPDVSPAIFRKILSLISHDAKFDVRELPKADCARSRVFSTRYFQEILTNR
ncbi:uncharacterized protein Z518_08296 [Rhinocladiella mackenziei CBS 650.93]|uniref:Rhinocladiella mackenziei CBS 650.93 unplaced genomic scaffold supercont1.6, whole genome shotgun sequence n=1 Tax=Rhinocladiella mackenziei CBS 650.93 TaxID=1442369 RepID=A0A0D2J0D8_9EURO|nr:uncharacterized protein Z518_08296 [Rhinocladiella mackenziei CBS 650.93]KIX02355.1 hypothetical protein Z518_08296 [Rhinocladiella mackenziei CBS 650.93]